MKIPRTPGGGGKGKPVAARQLLEWVDGQVLTLWVPHIAAPQGSHKQGFGKSVRETNPRTEPYRQAVADACERELENWIWTPLDGPVAMSITFYMPPLKTDPDRYWCIGVPDLDKVLRSTCDGLTKGKVWKDDARLVMLDQVKMVHAKTLEDTGVDIRVWGAT